MTAPFDSAGPPGIDRPSGPGGRREFVWGAATSAYQIEGATAEDGRTPSIWDTFARSPGKILDGGTGDVAIDHYHRFRDDIAIMTELGLKSYRFSISWPRVQPGGSGPVNPRGLDFYRRLTDALLEAGIEPWLTLYHWDLPQELEDAGGWPARETAYRFADFAQAVHEGLGDRVRNWITINEPWCAAFLGYASGEHAPGRREPAAAMRAVHHLLLAHGLATEAMRASRTTSEIGVGLNLYAVSPATAAEADRDSARRIDGLANRLFLDPVLRGRYPEDVLADAGHAPEVRDGDLGHISVPLDMLCVNYYSRYTVTADGDGRVSSAAAPTGAGSPWVGGDDVRFVPSGRAVTGMGWEIDESGLTEVLVRLAREYPRVPLVVTENGAAFEDRLTSEGEVHDPERVAYLRAHVKACEEAIAAGVPLRGYFVWSLFDNFEWAWGYTERFGLVYVDYPTQRRVIKDSGRWFTGIIRGHDER